MVGENRRRPARSRPGPLFTSQQFYLGGAAFGRGYGSAEISGDNGIAGSVELRFDQKLSYRYLTGYQLYGFVDAGTAWNDGYSTATVLRLPLPAPACGFSEGRPAGRHRVAVPLSYRAPDKSNPRRAGAVLAVERLELCPAWPQTRYL